MRISGLQGRGVALLPAAVMGVVLATGGCGNGSGPSVAPATPSVPKQSGPDRIRATPNPVVGGPVAGTTTISWDAPGAAVAIYVSVDGGAAKLFAKGGATGSAVAPFITANHNYAFELFPGASRHAQATVIVKHS